MARIEGTGIATPSKEASTKATAFLGGFQKKADEKFIKTYERKKDAGIDNSDFETDRYNKLKQKYGEQFSSDADTFERRDFFSMKTDPRNEVKVAATGDFSGTFDESDFQGYVKQLEIKNFKGLPSTMQRMLRENYLDDVKDGRYKEGQLINQTPVKEKPSFMDQTKNFAGSIFDAVTGTQPATASQIPGGMPSGTQFSPSGDTSFASYRMAGGQQQGSGIVTPFSETSMGKKEPRSITKFQDTSMGRKTVTIDGQEVARKQTVASLPSNYKQTEAEAFRKTATFKEAQGIAKRNPNVTVGVDSKGQPVARAVQKTRAEAGSSAKTAQGNKARVQQNAKARAQAAAVNRKISGKTISQTKAANKASMRKAAAERNASFQARKKAGKLSSSERTAKGQRAAKKAAARKRAQAAAKKRRAKKKSKK